MMGRELKSYPCARFNCNHMIKKNRPKRKILLKPGVKSARALIKNKCVNRLTKQRSMIKNKKVNLLIKPCTTSRESNFNVQWKLPHTWSPVLLKVVIRGTFSLSNFIFRFSLLKSDKCIIVKSDPESMQPIILYFPMYVTV